MDDATARVAEGIGQAGREGNSLALATWAVYSGWVHLAAGRLSAARDAADSLPPPQLTGATEQVVYRTLILAEVAAHTDDREVRSRRPMMHAMPTPSVHLANVEHQRMCWRGRRGIATTFMKQRAGLATSAYWGHPFSPMHWFG